MAQEEQQPQVQRQRKPRRPRQLSSTQVMFAVILAIALMLAVQFSGRIADERSLNTIRDNVQSEIEVLQREQTDLIDELDFVQSDAYVEQWAQSEGRMVRDGMVLVIPVPSSNTIQQTAPAQPITQNTPIETTLPDPESWQLWWALFFDVPPPFFGN